MDLTTLLMQMHEKGASDLFLTAGVPPSMKVDGKTVPVSRDVLTPEASMEIITNMMTPAQRDEFEATHECNFAVTENCSS